MPAFSKKTAVIRACTRVHHAPTEVVMIWRTGQRCHRSRCGLNMGVLGAHVCNNLDAIATTEQRLRTAFRSDVQVELSEEVPDNSESITGVDTRKVVSEFGVRNVTESMVDDGQQADRGRKTRSMSMD